MLGGAHEGRRQDDDDEPHSRTSGSRAKANRRTGNLFTGVSFDFIPPRGCLNPPDKR